MLSSSDKKSLEEIHRLFLQMEKSSRDFSFSPESLVSLKNKIQALQESSNPAVARLFDLHIHLVPSMTLRHFSSFAVPFERILNKNIQDSDFLVVQNDRVENLQEELPMVFVLDNIRSAFNVGSVFRTAECLGVREVFLCGYTPTPDQWKVERTAMGTQDHVKWSDGGRLSDCLRRLKSQNYHLVGLETAEHAKDLFTSFEMTPTAFIFGNERFGLDGETLKLLDEVRIIPLRGRKNSLNVGVTAAVAGFEWMRQWRIK